MTTTTRCRDHDHDQLTPFCSISEVFPTELPAATAMDSAYAIPPSVRYIGTNPSSAVPKHHAYTGLVRWDIAADATQWDPSDILMGTVAVPIFRTTQKRRRARSEDDLVYYTRPICDVVAELLPEVDFLGQITVGGCRLDLGCVHGQQLISAFEGKKKGFVPQHADLVHLALGHEQDDGEFHNPNPGGTAHQASAAAALTQLNHY